MNKHRGAVRVNDLIFLRMTTNVICQIEDDFGKSISQVCGELESSNSIKIVRSLFSFASNPKITQDDAGDLIDEIGITTAIEILSQAIEAAFSSGKATNEKKPEAPRQ